LDHEAAKLLDRNDAARLELVRGHAEKWVGGLTALTGLLGTVLIHKGPQSVSDIPIAWRVVVAALVGVALGLLAFATFRAYQSAYGDPGRLETVARVPLQGLHDRVEDKRKEAAEKAQAHLKHAVVATFVGIVALAVGVGATWFAPTDGSSSKTVCVLVDEKVIVFPWTSLTAPSTAGGVVISKSCT
jgi:hypothetical protein